MENPPLVDALWCFAFCGNLEILSKYDPELCKNLFNSVYICFGAPYVFAHSVPATSLAAATQTSSGKAYMPIDYGLPWGTLWW